MTDMVTIPDWVFGVFGMFAFWLGSFVSWYVTRSRWRDEMIRRKIARYNWMSGKWEWGTPPEVQPTPLSTDAVRQRL